MENKLYDIDALDREQYLQKACAQKELEILTTDYSTLFAELNAHANKQPFRCSDGKDYTFGQLMRCQALYILEHIKSYQTETSHNLSEQLMEWNALLRYNSELKLSQAISNLLRAKVPTGETIKILKSGYDEFRRDIEQAGTTDPSLATVDTFIENYRSIAEEFNQLWKRFPEYYVKHVLHSTPLPAQPDKTWLVLDKREESHDIRIPIGTAFVADTHADGTEFCYHADEEIVVGRMKLDTVSSILFKQTEVMVNNKQQKYVHTILKKEIKSDNFEQSTVMFDSNAIRNKDHKFITTGLMIESSMFILEEGERNFTIDFYLTPDSAKYFRQYATQMTSAEEQYRDIYYRLVKDAFYLKISTENGWENIDRYELKYIDQGVYSYFSLSFVLDFTFPCTVACDETFDCVTEMPALQVLINRDASIFPYTWARNVFFNKIQIKNEVKGITDLAVINELGQQDTSSSFYPFGIQGEKGDWLVIGNYEASVKPLTEMTLNCKWLQVPQDIGGFTTYYSDYKKRITNTSFRVRTEYLEKKSWKATKNDSDSLFSYDEQNQQINSESKIVWNFDNGVPTNLVEKERFSYGKVSGGFVRMVLDGPDFGFGDSIYEHLFINSFLQKSKKEELSLLNKPFVPVIDQMELSYKATETITSLAKKKDGKTRLYHITPIATNSIEPIQSETYAFVNGPEEEGYLKFAFSQAESYDRIRMYVELIPSHHEFEKTDVEGIKWYYSDGIQWVRIADESILDETDNFLNSGVIEIKLPTRVEEEYLDKSGLFWLYAAFKKSHLNYPSVYGFYLNMVRVTAELSDLPDHLSGTESLPAGSIRSLKKDLPGISSVKQPRAGTGGVEAEALGGMFFRTANQVLYRNRPTTPEDYERMVLEKFPQVDKVKCFPACDTKNNGRKGVVTLVVMQQKADEFLPLCPYNLLFDIEKEISLHTNPFVIVDAINPVFEEVLVKCSVTLKPGVHKKLFQEEIKSILDQYIAPWIAANELPDFGRVISVAEIREVLRTHPEIEEVHRVSVGILMVSTQKASLESQTIEKLLEFTDEKAYIPIKTSHPWYIRIPAAKHLVSVGKPEDYQEKLGIGELEIDNTLIIKK